MLLAIDIGNTTISCGLFKNSKLIKKWKIPTLDLISKKQNVVYEFARIRKKYIDAIILCSVVPEATKKLDLLLKSIFLVEPIIVGRDLKIPIKNLYKVPSQVGQDRLVGAYVGSRLYGQPLIIVDFGTAITIDVISKDKKYLGGIIVPGIEVSLSALSNNAALLPKVKPIKTPQSLIGKNTMDSMLSGIFYGFGSLCDGVVKKIKRQIGNCKVIATGGYVKVMRRYCECIDEIDADLTLRGLFEIFIEKSKKSKKNFSAGK